VAPIRVARHTLDGLPQGQARRCRWNPSPAQFGNASRRQCITVGTKSQRNRGPGTSRWRRPLSSEGTSERLSTASVPVAGRTASYARPPPPQRASVRKPHRTAATRAAMTCRVNCGLRPADRRGAQVALPGLRQRHRRCVRPRIPGFSPGGLGPHLTSSGFPRGLSSGFPFARRVLLLRPPSSGFPSSGVLRFVPFGRGPVPVPLWCPSGFPFP
jgi:hypothetical protein